MKKPSLIKIAGSCFLSFFLLTQFLFQSGCANIVPPEGGVRDSLPPVLTRSTPPNHTTSFTSDRITFTFDEFVDLDNYQQNMIVSPLPANMPTVNRKLNSISIRLRDTLQPNTTYSLNFGNSIKDVNEGNIMKDFTYIFSTGRYVDSFQLRGRVIDAETGSIDSSLVIMLHTTNEDSAVIKQRPRYIARVDGRGSFVFNNLPRDTFYVYALKDEGSYRYLSPKQVFAFADTSVITGPHTDSVLLRSYTTQKEDAATTKPAANARGSRTADNRLKFQTNLSTNRQDLLSKLIMTFETPLKIFDSSKLHLSTDSTYAPVTGYRWELDSARKKLSLNYMWKENSAYNLILDKDFATDTFGHQLLKEDTLNFKTNARNEYGKLSIRFRNLDLSKNPVLIFVLADGTLNSFPLTSELFIRDLFVPGEYSLRILNDTNKNGKWDPGEFFGKHKQPELVKPVPRKVTIRPNWDNLFEIAL